MIPLLEIHDNRCNLTPEKQDINSTNKTYTLNKKKPNPNTSKVVTLEKNLQVRIHKFILVVFVVDYSIITLDLLITNYAFFLFKFDIDYNSN